MNKKNRFLKQYIGIIITIIASISTPSAIATNFDRDYTDDLVITQGDYFSVEDIALEPSLSLKSSDSLKNKLSDWSKLYGYDVEWNTNKNLSFVNGIEYKGDFKTILNALARDIASMGKDLNFKVFKKNRVIVVYSVR